MSLFEYCREGYLHGVKKLVSHGSEDVNQLSYWFEKTPLFIASDEGHRDICQFLISSGANVNQATGDGETPLFMASENGDLEICQLLISSGANVNQANPNNGNTPLFIASSFGHLKTCQLLISSGANVNQGVYDGRTPLFMASENGYLGICKILVSSGADITKSSLDTARVQRQTHVIKFLEEKLLERVMKPFLFERLFNEESLFYEESLPLDLFKSIFKEMIKNDF